MLSASHLSVLGRCQLPRHAEGNRASRLGAQSCHNEAALARTGQLSHSFAKERLTPPSFDSLPLCFQVVLDGAVSSLQLSNLTSHTEYLVSVVPVYDTVVGDGLRGVTSTCRS